MPLLFLTMGSLARAGQALTTDEVRRLGPTRRPSELCVSPPICGRSGPRTGGDKKTAPTFWLRSPPTPLVTTVAALT